MKYLLLTACFCISIFSSAQNDPEFPKGAVFYLSIAQGKNTSFDHTPDLYVGTLELSPQFTIVPQHLRLGAIATLAYTDKHTSALFGPRLAWKIKTLKVEPLGSILNLQLQGDYLIGTRDQRMFGGNFTIEAFQLLTVQFAAHRDYALEKWWFRFGIGYNLFHKKRKSPTGDDPMSDDRH